MKKNITCLGLGFGTVANLHNGKFGDNDVEMVGVVDPDPAAQERAREAGITVYGSVAEAPRPDFYDLRVSTENHLEAMGQVLAVNSGANMLAEKPVTQFKDLDALDALLKAYPDADVVVNENYTKSKGTKMLKDAIEGRDVKSVIMNMSKHRGHQMIPGEDGKARFIDVEAGAFGYEGPHMLTILHDLGPGYLPGRDIIDASLTDMVLENHTFKEQGTGSAKYIAADGAFVEFYTSMDGKVGHFMGPYAPTQDMDLGKGRPHRILAVELGDGTKLITTYEPIPDQPRGMGAFTVINPGEEPLTKLVMDDTMGNHLGRVADYFRNGGSKNGMVNPCPVEDAVAIVRAQELLVGAARHYRG